MHVLELEAFFKWSNGVPREAPGMTRFIECSSLEEIDEEFHYNEFFPYLFRRYLTCWCSLIAAESHTLNTRMSWIPICPVDYDFCYNALDLSSGYEWWWPRPGVSCLAVVRYLSLVDVILT